MRVIAGSVRRLNLVTPKGMSTRPTSDKVKETLFNILAPELYGVSFLDLFAGSGGIGIEALSRGAARCTFVEKDKDAISCIRKNVATTHFEDRATICPFDVFSIPSGLKGSGKFDMVFMDPPYDQGLEEKALSMLARSGIIAQNALIIAEVSSGTDMSYAKTLGYEIIRIKEYKNNKHVFMRMAGSEDLS